MIQLLRTDSAHEDFQQLIPLLDRYLSVTDGDDHAFYNQFNRLDDINHVVLAYENKMAVGCGAFKKSIGDVAEIKRMFTLENARGKGVATKILMELESWAKQLNFKTLRLETGINQPEAIGLYIKNGYTPIPNYDQYVGMPLSKCFEKLLTS